MDISLRQIEDLEVALSLAPVLDGYAREAAAEFRDDPLPTGVTEAFLRRSFEDTETVLVVAESAPGEMDLGICLTGPFADPLSAERVPLILILYVDPSVRHRRVARALVDGAAALLAERGMNHLAARAGHNDDALISMGERWGFVRQWDLMLRE